MIFRAIFFIAVVLAGAGIVVLFFMSGHTALSVTPPVHAIGAVSYTHLTLPTNREV